MMHPKDHSDETAALRVHDWHLGPVGATWMAGCGGLIWRHRYVLHITDHRKHGPLFTERFNGRHGVKKRRFVHIGPYCVRGPRRG